MNTPHSSSKNPTPKNPVTQARVIGVAGNIVAIEADGSVMKNEVAYVLVGSSSGGQQAPGAEPTKLKSEVLRVYGNTADMQVYEDTAGIRVGDAVELTKEMLPAVLGPGLLGTIFDGLQNPLHELARRDGFFLKRGTTVPPLNRRNSVGVSSQCQNRRQDSGRRRLGDRPRTEYLAQDHGAALAKPMMPRWSGLPRANKGSMTASFAFEMLVGENVS